MNTDISAIEAEPYSKTSSKGRGEILKNIGFGNIDGMAYKYALWASHNGLSSLRMEFQIFIDATFKVTPNPFFQRLIMSYEQSSNVYVPCVFALMTNKFHCLYYELLHQIEFLLQNKGRPI
ncbi:hypothetical protein RF11_04807 [Thelohanellus kitauei]|uniref:MULE transposase domain-containing protein n=1 Tax=Thelohanellus kitauei TaxID=669202 RepID=A0A0C2J184_THEKT|nr:hypothetical protein RF11_04807 [Thelohanellus kitauei]